MPSYRLALHCGLLLCLCLTQLAPTQGKSLPDKGSTAAGETMRIPSTLGEDVLEAAFTAIEGILEAIALHAEAERIGEPPLLSQPANGDALDPECAPKPLPESWPRPDRASVACLKPLAVTYPARSRPGARAQAPAPAEDGMCTYPLECFLKVDFEYGIARWGCDQKAPQPRGWLNLCPEARKLVFAVMLPMLLAMIALPLIVAIILMVESNNNKVRPGLSRRPAADQPGVAGVKVN